jgi:hypothetical protein
MMFALGKTIRRGRLALAQGLVIALAGCGGAAGPDSQLPDADTGKEQRHGELLAAGHLHAPTPTLQRRPQRPRTAEHASAAVAVAWFELLYDLVKAERLSPPIAARTYGIASVALHEAVVPGMPRNRSLGGQLNDLPSMPRPGHALRHDWPVVANSVLAHTLRDLFAGGGAETQAAIDALEQRFLAEFQAHTRDEDFQREVKRELERSVARGREVGAAILAWAAGDGYRELHNCPYVSPTGRGFWEPTAPAFAANPLEPCWGRLRPMAVASGAVCAPPGPHEYSEQQGSIFMTETLEVYDTVRNRTVEQEQIARYWADDPGRTGTPPGHWVAITSQILKNDHLSLAAAVEAYARVGIAVNDGFITCWRTKYSVNLVRPVTVIRKLIDATWLPVVNTPPFPEYVSGHSTQSGAASYLLTDMFGMKAFTDTTHADHGIEPALDPRRFNSFFEAAGEAAISRLYGGIHFRAGVEHGIDQGFCVGRQILQRIEFRKRSVRDDVDDASENASDNAAAPT